MLCRNMSKKISSKNVPAKLLYKNSRFGFQKLATKFNLGRQKLATKIWPLIFLFFFSRGADFGRQFWPQTFGAKTGDQNSPQVPRIRTSRSNFHPREFNAPLAPKRPRVMLLSLLTPYSLTVVATALSLSQSCATCFMMLKHTWTAEAMLLASVLGPILDPKTWDAKRLFFQRVVELCRPRIRQGCHQSLLQY